MTAPGPLAILGAFLLGGGMTLRILVSSASDPIADVIPNCLLTVGGATVLLDRGLRRVPPLGWPLDLVPLLLLLGCWPLGWPSLPAGLAFASLAIAGLGLRALIVHEGLRHAVARSLVATGVFTAGLAGAQALYQRAAAREEAEGVLVATQQGRAFLESWRAAATFVNPNTFAGFLLLIAPLAVATWKRRRIVPLVTLAVGFLASGSVGATLAAFSAGCLELRRSVRWRLPATIAVLALPALVVILVTVGAQSDGVLASKSATLRERLDYHRQAARLLPEVGLIGIGWERFGERAPMVQRAGEARSRYVHGSFAQALLELGPASLVLALLVGIAVRNSCRLGDFRDVATVTDGLMIRRAFGGGVVGGAFIAPLLAPAVTLFPLRWTLANAPTINGLVAASAIGGVALLFSGPLRPASIRFALLAFGIHQLVDFDLYNGGAAITAAALLATLPSTRLAANRFNRPAMIGVAILGLTLPLALVHQADEDQIVRDLLLPGATHPEPVKLPQGFPSFPRSDLAEFSIDKALVANRPDEALGRLEALPPSVRELPGLRRLEALALVEWTRIEPSYTLEALRRVRGLVRPGELVEGELLFRQHRLERALGRPEAIDTARAAMEAARRFGLNATSAPYAANLERYLESR